MFQASGPLRAGTYPGFCDMKRPGVFLLPPGLDASPLQILLLLTWLLSLSLELLKPKSMACIINNREETSVMERRSATTPCETSHRAISEEIYLIVAYATNKKIRNQSNLRICNKKNDVQTYGNDFFQTIINLAGPASN